MVWLITELSHISTGPKGFLLHLHKCSWNEIDPPHRHDTRTGIVQALRYSFPYLTVLSRFNELLFIKSAILLLFKRVQC